MPPATPAAITFGLLRATTDLVNAEGNTHINAEHDDVGKVESIDLAGVATVSTEQAFRSGRILDNVALASTAL
jgi:hypothetical protein